MQPYPPSFGNSHTTEAVAKLVPAAHAPPTALRCWPLAASVRSPYTGFVWSSPTFLSAYLCTSMYLLPTVKPKSVLFVLSLFPLVQCL